VLFIGALEQIELLSPADGRPPVYLEVDGIPHKAILSSGQAAADLIAGRPPQVDFPFS